MLTELYIAPPDHRPASGEPAIDLHDFRDALDAIQLAKARGDLAPSVTVWCRGGRYPVRRPVVIGPEDSHPVVFRAAPGETPVFDGGIYLDGWSRTMLDGKEVLVCAVPEGAVFHEGLIALHVNGRRKTVAATPKLPDVLTPARDTIPDDSPHGYIDRMAVSPGDFDPSWHCPHGISLLLFQLWTESHLPVAEFDAGAGLVRFSLGLRRNVDIKSTRYVWRNVREALTEPGEYYFDPDARRLYYWPEAGETPETLEAVVPGVGVLLALAGRPATREWVRGLRFEGLTFRHGGVLNRETETMYGLTAAPGVPSIRNHLSRWKRPEGMTATFGGGMQASIDVPGVIMAVGAKDCAFEDCVIERSNWYGLCLAGGCSDWRIVGNTFADLGGGGLIASGAAASLPVSALDRADAGPDEAVHHLVVTDNHVHHCGEHYTSAVGILLGHASHNLVEHNHVHDLYYTAISCGWIWGYGENVSRENRIGFNHLHDIGKERLCDMGGIYTLGVQPGTRLYHNHIHDVSCRFYGGWGLYTDEGSGHIVLENNICYDCSREGIHQHYGRENVARGNVCAFGRENGFAITSGHNRQTGYGAPGENYANNYNFIGNVLVVDGTPFFRVCLPEAWTREQFFSELNWFWDVAGDGKAPFAVGQEGLALTEAAWKKMGHDLHSVRGDPGFANIRRRDFRLKRNSPLRAAGFPDPAITLDKAGIRKRPKSTL